MFCLEFDAPTSVQLSLFPGYYPPVPIGDLKRHRVEVSSLELWSNWRAAAHHYVFELGGTDEGFKRMFLLRCPIGPTAQDLESFLDGQMEEILVYRRAKSAEVRNREAVTRSRTTAEKEKLEKQEYWRRTGRR